MLVGMRERRASNVDLSDEGSTIERKNGRWERYQGWTLHRALTKCSNIQQPYYLNSEARICSYLDSHAIERFLGKTQCISHELNPHLPPTVPRKAHVYQFPNGKLYELLLPVTWEILNVSGDTTSLGAEKKTAVEYGPSWSPLLYKSTNGLKTVGGNMEVIGMRTCPGTPAFWSVINYPPLQRLLRG